jgi:hypothetical protein
MQFDHRTSARKLAPRHRSCAHRADTARHRPGRPIKLPAARTQGGKSPMEALTLRPSTQQFIRGPSRSVPFLAGQRRPACSGMPASSALRGSCRSGSAEVRSGVIGGAPMGGIRGVISVATGVPRSVGAIAWVGATPILTRASPEAAIFGSESAEGIVSKRGGSPYVVCAFWAAAL